jgi:hypothetical protein
MPRLLSDLEARRISNSFWNGERCVDYPIKSGYTISVNFLDNCNMAEAQILVSS